MAFPEVLPVTGKDNFHYLAHGWGDKTILQSSGKRRQLSHALLIRKKVNPWYVGEVWISAALCLSFTIKISISRVPTLKKYYSKLAFNDYLSQIHRAAIYQVQKLSHILKDKCAATILKLHCSKLSGFSRAGANLSWLHIATWFSTPSHVMIQGLSLSR